jgi:putative radical SAM enzyme (TIGR03279 family)
MKHLVTRVDSGSIADEIGIKPNWKLVSVNGNTVRDVIDYELFTNEERVSLLFEDECGEEYLFEIEKESWEPLGLNFETGLMSPVRQCANHCIFCFIDQMPRGHRDTLYFKDDDWRLSLIMGNYVTLTNVSDTEFRRILERRVSPLYISVHATDGAIRKLMMGSKNADRIMERLTLLHEHGLKFNAQIVLCPGLNDKEVLKKSLCDLYSLSPEAQSVAVVPVGLTRHREGLYPLRPLTREDAREAIALVDDFAKEYCEGFAFCSDEMYLRAGFELPPYEYYGAFDQLENGVGMFRLFEDGFLAALEDEEPLPRPVRFCSVSGVAIAENMQALFDKLKPYGITISVLPVRNDFFGESVTVSGLVTAGDIIKQGEDGLLGEAMLLPSTMMREMDDVFLDGIRLPELSERFSLPIHRMPPDDGEEFIRKLFDLARSLLNKE